MEWHLFLRKEVILHAYRGIVYSITVKIHENQTRNIALSNIS